MPFNQEMHKQTQVLPYKRMLLIHKNKMIYLYMEQQEEILNVFNYMKETILKIHCFIYITFLQGKNSRD